MSPWRAATSASSSSCSPPNTLEYLRRERHLATDQPDLPATTVEFKNRQTLIVVRGIDFREDLLALHRSGYIREIRPVLIGVDGGADALLGLGLKPRHHHRRHGLGQRGRAANAAPS